MAFTTTVLLQLVGALLVVALGLAVGSVRRGSAANLWFASFAVSLGGQFVVTNLGAGLEVTGATWYPWARILLRSMAVVAAVGFGLSFPQRVERRDRRAIVAAVAVSAVTSGLWLRLAGRDLTAPVRADRYAWVVMFSVLFFLLVLFALRHRRVIEPARHQLALMSAALLLYTGFAAGAGVDLWYDQTVFSADPSTALAAGAQLLVLVGLACVWLWNATHSDHPRRSRNVALVALATPLAGMVHVAYLPDFGMLGIARTFMVAVLAYAIVRHQLLGIDVKLRWGISKTTVAAVFIAVFFIASEAAQTFFGEQLQNEYVGIAAAGLLVLAIAPLQRLADKVAAKAVPVAGGTGDPDRRAESLRTALRLAYRDGTVTAEEEMALAHIAGELGFRPDEYLALRTEVASEADAT